MQISIQSLEVTYNKVPYRFIVKKVFNSRNEISFHCWAPEDSEPSKKLVRNEVLMFDWDHQSARLRHHFDHPVNNTLKEAIAENFPMEKSMISR